MHLRLDHHSGEPVYRQIVEAVKYKVASGQLAGGDPLPSIRALTEQLKVNPGTVVKAYDELAHAGLVVMQQGKGVFVTADRNAAPVAVRRRVLADLARRLLAEASRMGAGADEVRRVLDQVISEMEPKP